MVSSWLRLGATLALSLTALALNPRSEPAPPPAVPGSYIVEFDDALTTTDGFLATLAKYGIEVTRSLDLSFSLFQGASFSLLDHHNGNDASTVETIASIPGVKSVSPVREHSLPPQTVSAAESVLSSPSWSALRSRQVHPSVEAIHQMTGVDKLRSEGYTGAGIKVAVVDTGVDYNHPALGGCFGEGCLISFGEDLVGDGRNSAGDSDPYDNCSGHGTHVSGIIAAQKNQYGFTGVAPNVTLGHYRVLNCNGAGSTDIIIQAYKLAYEAGADIITASVGLFSGWTSEPWGVVIQRITEAGVPCLVAVGNNGELGLFMSSNGADGIGATGVGSIDSIEAPMFLFKASYTTGNGTRKDFGWVPGSDFANGTYPLYVVSHNATVDGDACEPLPSSTPDLSKSIVLIRRGGCPFVEKMENAAAAGAQNVLFYNSGVAVDGFSYEVDGIEGSGMIPGSTGEEFVKLAAAGVPVKLTMASKESAGKIYQIGKNDVSGGFLSAFTEWGPTNDLYILPTVSAPGGFIMSTYPLDLGGYAVESGTSMATPFVAGCMALILEAKGKISPRVVNALLSSNANPNLFHDGAQAHPWLGSVAQQGAGLINVYDAVHATTLLNVTNIAFNDTEHLRRSVAFSVQNTSPQPVTYSLANVASGTVYTLPDDGSSVPAFFDGDSLDTDTTSPASLAFSPAVLSLAAGQTSTVTVTVTPPRGLTASRIPIYSGYITLNGTNGDTLSIPYLGAATAMRNVTILDTRTGENQLIGSGIGPVTSSGHTFHVPAPSATVDDTVDITYPGVNLRLSMGTSYFRIDVKSFNNGTSTNSTSASTSRAVAGSGKIIGSFAPNYYQWRTPGNPRETYWTGALEEGGYAPAGTYSFVVRALKIFGDPKKASDYDVVETKKFRLSYVA